MLDKPFKILHKNKAAYGYFKHQWFVMHNLKKNMLSLTTGGAGDGKSWATIIHNYFIDPRFTLDKIVWNENQFYDALGNIKYIGEFILWDEAGLGIPAKEWYSIINRTIGKTLQILRADVRGGVTFTTHDLSFIDSQSRKLLNYFFQMQKRTSPNESTMYMREIMTNRMTGKILMPYPRLRIGSERYRLKYLTFSLNNIRKIPDLYNMLTEYDKKAAPVKRKMRLKQKTLLDKAMDQKEAQENEKVDNKLQQLLNIKAKILANPSTYLTVGGTFDADLIAVQENISKTHATVIKKMIDKELIGADQSANAKPINII
jgi:hypothetical protein